MSTRYIISGFDCIGKSTAAYNLPGIVVDMEPSDYHWTFMHDGEKTLNPEWPINYIKAIIGLALETNDYKYRDLLYICISAHKEVLDYLDELDIKYAVAFPDYSAKDEYIERVERRVGSDPKVIAKFKENYETFIDDIRSHGKVEICLKKGEFLFDKLDKVSFERYLISEGM